MEITLGQGIGLTILAFIVGMDFYLESLFIFRPLVVGTIAGIIVGDLQLGLIGGGLAELAFAGLTPAGGTQPPNPILAGIMTVVLAHTSNLNPATALGLALPFSFLMQYVILGFYSAFCMLMRPLEKCVESGNDNKYKRIMFGSWILVGLSYAVVVFLCSFLAQDFMKAIVNHMPEWLTHSFDILGGILPAIGFAMLLKIMLKGWLVPYLIIGFVYSAFVHYSNILPLALIGVALAIYEFYNNSDQKTNSVEKEEETDGI